MVGKIISHCQMLEKIGEGGMGVIYKAEDTKLGRTVAFKFLAAHLLESEEHKQRFLREAKAAASLNRPNICMVHDGAESHAQYVIGLSPSREAQEAYGEIARFFQRHLRKGTKWRRMKKSHGPDLLTEKEVDGNGPSLNAGTAPSPTNDMNPARKSHLATFLCCVMMSSLVMAVVVLAACAKGPTRVQVLVKGSPIHGANGIMFDNQDRLHIASVWGNEIVVMDPKTGRVLQRLGSDKGVYTPDDLAFGPDGSLYWTSILTGAVGRLSPDGSTKAQIVAPGVNPITFNAKGRLFVGLCFLGDGLFELDPALVLPPIPRPKAPGMLNGFDFGPDGLLYSPVFFDGRVVRMNVDSVPVKYETVAVGFATPAAVKFDSHGRLHGHSGATGEVWRLDPITGSKVMIVTLPPGTDNLAFDSRGRLFVSHAQDGSIFEVLPAGEPRTISEGGMILPGGVAVLAGPQGGESVFVADCFSLRSFNGLTGQPNGVARYFFDPTGITAPMTVSTDGGNLVLSSWVGRSVQVWNPETRRVLENHTGFALPVNAIRFQGDLVVAELGTHSVVRVTARGRVRLTDALTVPAGLAAAGGDLWVSDRTAGMVWRIVSDGVGLPNPVRVAAGLNSPEGLAVDYDGSLLVVESGIRCLSRISVTTGQVIPVADGLELGAAASPGMPSTWVFNGVAVGPSRAIYVTGDKANVLYRIQSSR